MVIINGEGFDLAGKTLTEYLAGTNYDPKRIALERNGEIVPKGQYGETVLADGVHVGIEDVLFFQIRKSVGKDFIIGATAKTTEQAKAEENAGADYLGVGAVFPSPTKENAVRITPERLKESCSSVSLPTVAIGGIGLDNIGELKGGGMNGVAVVSAIFGAEDIQETVRRLKEKAKAVII